MTNFLTLVLVPTLLSISFMTAVSLADVPEIEDVQEASGIDLGVEKDFSTAGAEAILAAEDEARQRAKDEKVRVLQEREVAERETANARSVEAESKKRFGRWLIEERANRLEKQKAMERTRLARQKSKQIRANILAKEAELVALKEAVDRAVLERDEVEAELEKSQERLAGLQESAVELERTRLAENQRLKNAREALKKMEKAKQPEPHSHREPAASKFKK